MVNFFFVDKDEKLLRKKKLMDVFIFLVLSISVNPVYNLTHITESAPHVLYNTIKENIFFSFLKMYL